MTKTKKQSYSNRNLCIDRLLKTFFFVTGRYSTTSKELSEYLSISRKQSLRILDSFCETSLLECHKESRVEGSGFNYSFRFPLEWRRKHKFF